LALLEKRLLNELKVSVVEKSYVEILINLEHHSKELQRLKNEKEHRYGKLIELKTAILGEAAALKALSNPLSKTIREIEALRKAWIAEKKKWSAWEASFLMEAPLKEVKLILETGQKTIDTAINLILRNLKPMLVAQQKAGKIQAKIDFCPAEAESLITAMKGTVLLTSTPPMLLSKYFSQFKDRLWYEIKNIRKLTVSPIETSGRNVSHAGDKYNQFM
jgi:hypothetical protein